MSNLETFDNYEDYLNWLRRYKPSKKPFSRDEFYHSFRYETFDNYEDYLNWLRRYKPSKKPFSRDEFYHSFRYKGFTKHSDPRKQKTQQPSKSFLQIDESLDWQREFAQDDQDLQQQQQQ